jgi:hypothetical protein
LFRLLRVTIALLGCLHLCGGAAGVLQGVAWARMLCDYSQQAGLVEGAKMTFDGEHPCEMCKAIAQSHKEDSKSKEPSDLTANGLVLKNLLPCASTVIPASNATEPPAPVFAAELSISSLFGESPPVPPPRWNRLPRI